MSVTKGDLQNIHLDLTNKVVSAEVLDEWITDIGSGKKVKGDFVNWITSKDEYVALRLIDLKRMFYLHVGYSISSETIEAFKHFVRGRSVPNEEELYRFVVNTQEFRDTFFPKIVRAIADIRKIDEGMVSIDIVNKYMDKFRHNSTYSMQHLYEDVKSDMSLFEQTSDITPNDQLSNDTQYQDQCANDKIISKTLPDTLQLVDPMDVFLKITGRQATKEELSNVDQYVHALLDSLNYTKNAGFGSMVINKDLLSAFQKTFGRPMYVEEYAKYSCKNDGVDFDNVYICHVQNYNRLRQIIETFQIEPFTEHDFVQQYLDDVDSETFFDNIVTKLVHTDNYCKCMKEQIVKIYSAMFGINLRQVEVDHIFDSAQKAKTSLYDDGLRTLLVNYKSTCDLHEREIVKVYDKVLQREPDDYELTMYCDSYREDCAKGLATFEQCSATLEKTLINSLEFHDIVKSMIKEIYQERFDKPISPSKLFKILGNVSNEIMNCSMYSEVFTLVEQKLEML